MRVRRLGRALWWVVGSVRAVPLHISIVGVLLLLALVIPQESDRSSEAIVGLGQRLPLAYGIARALGLTAIYRSWPFIVSFGLLMLNLLVGVVRRARRLGREMCARRLPSSPDELAAAPHYVCMAVSCSADDVLPHLAGRLRAKRFRVSLARDDRTLYGIRNRHVVIGSFVFHASLLLLVLGAAISIGTRFHGTVVLAEGEPFSGKPTSYTSYSPRDLEEHSFPHLSFEVQSITVQHDSADNLLDAFVDIRTPDPPNATARIRVNQPYRTGSTGVRLTEYGFAPVISFRYRDRPTRTAGFRLVVIPPGKEDSFAVPGLPYHFHLRLYPEFVVAKDGAFTSRSSTLRKPVAVVRVEATDGSQQEMRLAAGGPSVRWHTLALRLMRVPYWARLDVDRDRGRPIVFLALGLAVLGLLWRLLLPRWEISACIERTNDDRCVLHLGGRSDYTREPFKSWFDRLKASIEGASA